MLLGAFTDGGAQLVGVHGFTTSLFTDDVTFTETHKHKLVIITVHV